MPCFDIVRKSDFDKTFRVNAVINAFDLQVDKIRETFKGCIDIDGREWNVGLIVGASGTGKTTIARELWPDKLKRYTYTAKSVIDDMPRGYSNDEVIRAFGSVGFNSVPSWLKPYHVLSQGEQMRVDLARSLLDEDELVVFDEFTSVVDRQVARVGCHAVQKAVRRSGKRFVAVSCHRDIIEWLSPDWIYDTDSGEFFFSTRGKGRRGHESRSLFTNLEMKLKQGSGSYLGSTTI